MATAGADMLFRHLEGLLNYCRIKVPFGLVEAVNGNIKALLRRGSGRAIHIHVRIRTYSGSQQLDPFTAQLFFDDTLTDQVFTLPPYNTRRARDTRNSNDMVLTGTRGTVLYPALTKTPAGYSGSVDIGVNLKTPTISTAVIASSGVVSSASFQPGVSPGAWITIFGQNLAASTHSLTTAELVDGALPTALSGVSVSIDNKPAFIQYVSPTQINVQAPADSNSGSVPVTVTNASGTSNPVTATLQQVQPAFFTSENYVAAVRSDGTIIGGTQPAKPGDVLSLYGTELNNTEVRVDNVMQSNFYLVTNISESQIESVTVNSLREVM